MKRHAAIVLILIGFLGLGVTYSLVNPIFESPDEVWHYEYVRYLAEGHGLPVSDLVAEMPWHQEGSQPPLYYLLGAGLTFWIDTSDAEAVIRYNPHAAVGLADAPDNKNMVAHSAPEAFPYRGTVLAAHVVRLLSVLMGVATVACTYLIALTIFPGRRTLAALAAAIVAFNPQFIFISASVNNDNLVTLCSAVALLLVCIWWQGDRPACLALPPTLSQGERGRKRCPLRLSLPLALTPALTPILSQGEERAVLLGLVAGLAAISKLSGLLLFPFIALVLAVMAWRRRSFRALMVWGVQAGLPFLAVAGWWYWRNWRLYDEPLGLTAMFAVLPARTKGPDLAELLARAEGVFRSAWAVFGWFNVVADPWLYAVYGGLTLAGVLGLGVLFVRRLRRGDRAGLATLVWPGLWSLIVVAGLVGWSQKRYPQGRLLFPAISAASVLLAAGLIQGVGRLPDRWQRAGTGVLVGALFVLAVWAPFRYIVPAYAPPPLLAELPSRALPRAADFGGQVRLLGYELREENVRPGEALHVTLYWEALAAMDRDYSVFIHLVDDHDLIVAQRDSYPAGGNGITSRWPAGAVISDRHVIQIPVIAPAPCQARLLVGLYDYGSGERLETDHGGDSVDLAGIYILSAEGMAGVSNPVYFDFEGKLALVGFDLDRRLVHPGETLHLTLYWQALSPMAEDYTVFTHLLLPPDQVWAQDDQQPGDGQMPTSTWQPGQIIEERYELTLPPETPSGVYEIEVGLYLAASGDRLRVGLSDAGIVVGRVRVSGP
ncbi:MAG: glycosyltransferase family 39 protein [Anaerolineae bacterium]|nr:glycosyltransferase family 39 protein [Anaerolineae bacterium]